MIQIQNTQCINILTESGTCIQAAVIMVNAWLID